MKKIRILVVGGGSGGHIYPIIAVVEQLKKLGVSGGAALDVRYFGSAGSYEPELAGAGIRITRIAPSKLRRYLSFWNAVDFIRFIWSIPQALAKVFWFMPDVAFSKGGPGAIAVLGACRFYRIPIVIHDSDAIPGLSSRATGRFAKKIELAFPSAAQYFPAQKANVRIVGVPVREGLIVQEEERTQRAALDAKRALDMDPALPLILVLGGSQGAAGINTFIMENLSLFLERYNVLHQVGMENFSAYRDALRASPFARLSQTIQRRYRPVPFFTRDLKTALIAADLVMSRAGAGALFEIAMAGKPSILIPLPNSASNHQAENAFQYREAGACIVIEEENLIGNLVLEQIDALMKNPERLKKMSASAIQFYKPDAAANIAKDIFMLAE